MRRITYIVTFAAAFIVGVILSPSPRPAEVAAPKIETCDVVRGVTSGGTTVAPSGVVLRLSSNGSGWYGHFRCENGFVVRTDSTDPRLVW